MKKKMPKKKHIHDIQDEQAFFIDALETVHSDKPEEWRITLFTNGKGINYKLGTGSQVNILLWRNSITNYDGSQNSTRRIYSLCHTASIVFQWTAVEQKFEELKAILTSIPVLKFFDSNKEIKISSDASSFGLGAVLLQRHDTDCC